VASHQAVEFMKTTFLGF